MGLRPRAAAGALAAAMLPSLQVSAQPAARPELSAGDSWVYAAYEGGTGASPGNFESIESITVSEIIERSGAPSGYRMARSATPLPVGDPKTSRYAITLDLNNYARANASSPWQEAKWLQWPLEAGARWKFEIPLANGVRVWEAHADGWEEVEVPAGRFKTIRIVYDMVRNPDPLVTWQVTLWYAPAVKAWVKKTDFGQYEASFPIKRDTRELKSYVLH